MYQGSIAEEKELKIIRPTDNSLKECDLTSIQTTEPLKLTEEGVPEDWKAPQGDKEWQQ